MATFVLVHGGGHGGWCYRKVAALLRAAGHDVHTPTLTGLAERAHLLRPDIDLETHIEDVAALVRFEDLHDIVLVGHSYGGMVVTGVADRLADRIADLVYLDAAHPRDGESLVDVAPDQMAMLRASLRVENGVELAMWPMPGLAGFLGITDPDDAAWTDAKLTPHPWACFTQKLRLRNGDAARRIRRTNINCTEALANSPPDRRARQLDGDRDFEIDTGHDLMITEPRAVADMLIEIAAA